MGASSTAFGIGRDQLGALALDAARWWRAELASLFPPTFVSWMLDDGRRTLLLVPEESALRLVLRDSAGKRLGSAAVPAEVNVAAAITAFLHSHKLRERDVSIGVVLPGEQFFVREFMLPRAVEASLDTVALQDLLRKTPFQAEDIHYGCASQRAGDRLHVHQLVLRRKFVESFAASTGVDPNTLDFAEKTDAQGENASMPIVRLRQSPEQTSWLRIGLIGLTATFVFLCAAALFQHHQRQEAELEELTSRVTAARVKAQDVRAKIDAVNQRMSTANQLRIRKRDTVSILHIWGELSQRLPDHSWVSELRVAKSEKAGPQITITGFSQSAASLVELIERSPLFNAAALTAPIAIDPVQQRERFVLQAVAAPEQQVPVR